MEVIGLRDKAGVETSSSVYYNVDYDDVAQQADGGCGC